MCKKARASKELGGMARRTAKSKPIKNNNKGIFFRDENKEKRDVKV
jgi:hypothetical protein